MAVTFAHPRSRVGQIMQKILLPSLGNEIFRLEPIDQSSPADLQSTAAVYFVRNWGFGAEHLNHIFFALANGKPMNRGGFHGQTVGSCKETFRENLPCLNPFPGILGCEISICNFSMRDVFGHRVHYNGSVVRTRRFNNKTLPQKNSVL